MESFCKKIRSLPTLIRKKDNSEDPASQTIDVIPAGKLLYPNCDLAIWLRSCEVEITTPIEGVTSGVIPIWIRGALLRNGPGKIQYNRQRINHLFDASGLLHRFAVNQGRVTYQCQFVRSKSYLRNSKAQQLTVAEFATPPAPDPCKTIFHRIASLFILDHLLSDNAMISISSIGDEWYTFAETPFIHRIDPTTLDTIGRENLHKKLGILCQTSHPHNIKQEGVYNVGQVMGSTGPSYVVMHFPTNEGAPLEKGRIISRINSRNRMQPSYMHSFSITPNYFVIIEQPLFIRMNKVIPYLLRGKPLIHGLKWRQEKTMIRIICRKTSQEFRLRYCTESLFFLHTINAYEDEQHLVVDICCYKDAQMIDCMYVQALQEAQINPDYAKLFRGRPKRFVLPLEPEAGKIGNLNRLSYSLSQASWIESGLISIEPDELCPLGCETPRIHYELFNGFFYRYFYAISSDVDADNPGTLIKVDTYDKKVWTWSEPNLYASEPVFVPRPEAQSEDDGVVLSSLIWGGRNECRSGFLVLDARTWTEIGRTEFRTPSPVPKCLHGWFVNE